MRGAPQSQRILIGKDAAQGFGRVFPFSRLKPGNNGYSVSCNMNIQGSCADASMLALAHIDDRLFDADIDGGLVGWLHDEFIIEVREDQADRAAEIVKQAMMDGFAETFPGAPLNGLVEPHIGVNWDEAKAGEIRTASSVTLLRPDVPEDEALAPAFEHVDTACEWHSTSEGVAMSHSASQTDHGRFPGSTSAEAVERAA